jgi:hypothetical protein
MILQEETEVYGEKTMSQCHCVYYKSNTDRAGIEPEPSRIYVE